MRASWYVKYLNQIRKSKNLLGTDFVYIGHQALDVQAAVDAEFLAMQVAGDSGFRLANLRGGKVE